MTESDFKKYFDQFGTITDVVVMYDHNTQRPRGFGFITYDSEEAVDKVLLKTFHELNGKMVEVKRAVPKELSPGPSRTPLGGYNYGLTRVNSFLNGFTQGYTPSTVGGYGLRADDRFSPVAGGRSGFAPFGSGYGMSMNFEPGLNAGFGGNANFNSNLSYDRVVNPYFIGNSNRFGTWARKQFFLQLCDSKFVGVMVALVMEQVLLIPIHTLVWGWYGVDTLWTTCRNVPFTGERGEAHGCAFKRRKDVRSRHQRLFVVNVGKIEGNRSK